MKKHDIEVLREKGLVDSVKIVRSPSDSTQWVVLIKKFSGKSFFLIFDDDHVRTYTTIDAAVEELDALGFVRAEVMF